MPAPAKNGRGGAGSLLTYLNSQAPRLPVRHAVSLGRYHRSLDLLLSQADAYRAARNEEQLYVMLLRYASMVIETIKQHKDFDAGSALYKQAHQRALACVAEAEQLKVSLLARNITQPSAHTSSRPPEAQRITDGSLPDIDWESVPAAPAYGAAAAAAAASAPPQPSAPPAPPGSLELSADLEWPPRSSSSGGGAAAAAAAAAGAAAAGQPAWEPLTYSSHYAPSSAQLVQKHSLFGPRGGSGSSRLQPQGSANSSGSRARYPSFDSSPIDALWAAPPPSQQQQQQLPDMAGLSLQQQQAALAIAQQPSAGPSLGPQEVEVQSMLPCQGAPDGTCAQPPPGQLALAPPPSRESAAEAAAAAAAGPKSLSKRLDLRDVHISVALMNDFIHYANANTRRGIESCGILAGRLSASDSRFTVTTLIVPKQTGTSDTVEMLAEEEVWEVESSRELVPLGWIHTHPTQTCFLSSVDIHTQCGYQTMLEEAVAIVMAPRDGSRRCGIFRLSTPDGLDHVQRCTYRGFHAGCGSGQYELCGHVYLNPGAAHEVIDLR